jgi:hypothetical protein
MTQHVHDAPTARASFDFPMSMPALCILSQPKYLKSCCAPSDIRHGARSISPHGRKKTPRSGRAGDVASSDAAAALRSMARGAPSAWPARRRFRSLWRGPMRHAFGRGWWRSKTVADWFGRRIQSRRSPSFVKLLDVQRSPSDRNLGGSSATNRCSEYWLLAI